MSEPSAASVGTPTTRSGAIYKNADLLYALVEAETAHAIQPYQEALKDLKQQLDAVTVQNARLTESSKYLVSTSVDNAVKEFDALKATLEENGIGVTAIAGRKTLCFVGERATLISQVDAQVKRFAPNPELYTPISPSSIVEVLAQCLTDCENQLKRVLETEKIILHQREELKRILVRREAEAEAETRRTDAQRTQLETSVREEQTKVTALTNALSVLRTEAQAMSVRNLSARKESDEWKTKFHAMETERDSLKIAIDTSDGNLVSAQGDLEVWKGRCVAAEANLKTANDESDAKLLSMQTEVDEWKAKCLVAEAELKTVTDEGNDKLAAAQSEVDMWKARSLTADGERDSAQGSLREANAKHAEELDATKSELADWETKNAAWNAERNRHKSQTARNAALITQLKSTQIPELEARLLEAEMERDELKASLESENAKALVQNNALRAELEEMRRKVAAPTSPPKLSSPKTPSSMFIKPRAQQPPASRPPLPDKPLVQGPLPTSPPWTATTSASPMQTPQQPASSSTAPPAQSPQSLGPVVGLQGSVPVRRGVVGSPATSTGTTPGQRSSAGSARGRPAGVLRKASGPQPRAPPVLTPNATGSGEMLIGAKPIVRMTRTTSARRDSETPMQPAESTPQSQSSAPSTRSKRSAEDASSSPSVSKRPALSSQSNTSLTSTPKPVPESSLKRSAPSPLPSERSKVPRISEPLASSRSSFTKPPTVIPMPSQPRRTATPTTTPDPPSATVTSTNGIPRTRARTANVQSQ
ncbi:hypothetical protein B0H11DRAFT_2198605 [Mycena galericulata]|nr:hypothetical protein B0H11DRAFT_2198605 [Mycena galericulata]